MVATSHSTCLSFITIFKKLSNPLSIVFRGWSGNADFTSEVSKLGELFNENFEQYADEASDEVKAAGPKLPSDYKPEAKEGKK